MLYTRRGHATEEADVADLTEIEGVGTVYADQLKAAGVGTTEALLEAGGSPNGRKDIAGKTGIPEGQILKWVNHVDLFRISGVSEEYADLLEAAGVDTVVELAQRNAANLHSQVVKVNGEKQLVRQVPAAGQVEGWIEQAKGLPRLVTY
jgi:predicted flap endonuclease-1-like 5' DNA nuclease